MEKYNIGDVWWIHFPYEDEDKEKRKMCIRDRCLLSGETGGGISAGGGLCSQHGSEHKGVPPGPDPGFQYPFCLCYRLCRPGVLCGDRGSPISEKPV